jgi:hypothetical protein
MSFKISGTITRNMFFFLLLIGLCWVYHYADILAMRPKGIHQWRQTECLSTTDNYYQHGMHFLEPEGHLQESDHNTSGNYTLEFPLLYYIVAALWKVFGRHEFIFRLLNILISFAGLFALFKMAGRLLNDYFWSLAVTLFLFCSPIFVNYSNSFIINAPAFSLMLIACYFFFRFWEEGRERFFYISMFIFLFVGLLKVSTLISFFVIGLLCLLEVSGLVRLSSNKKIFRQPLLQLLSMTGVLIGITGWYTYMSHYNAMHHALAGSYTGAMMPLWKLSAAELSAHWQSFKDFLIYQIYSIPAFIFLLICCFLLATRPSQVPTATKLILPLLFFGYLSVILIFSQSFTVHDYYHIDSLAFTTCLCMCSFYFLKTRYPALYQSRWSKITFALFLVFNILYCENNMSMRYWRMNDATRDYRRTFASKSEMDWWNYMNFAYFYGPYETATPVLRKLGLKPDDKVICPEDESPAISLYLLEQKGWTKCTPLNDSDAIAAKIGYGASYLILSDTNYYRKPAIRPFIHYPLGQSGQLHVFDLRPYARMRK